MSPNNCFKPLNYRVVYYHLLIMYSRYKERFSAECKVHLLHCKKGVVLNFINTKQESNKVFKYLGFLFVVLEPRACALDDVLEAEGALAGEPLAAAAAAQVLSVRPLGVHVPLRHRAGAARFVARLEERDCLVGNLGGGGEEGGAYVTRDVLHAVRVEVLLAFSTELFEVNLKHKRSYRTAVTWSGLKARGSPCWFPERTTRRRSPIAGCTLCSGSSHTSAPGTEPIKEQRLYYLKTV